MPLAERILKVFEEGLSLWKIFLSTRQEAYNRKMDKRQERAIHYAEQAFEKVGLLFNFIHENLEIPDNKRNEFERFKILIYRLKDKFNKYD